MNFLFSKVQNRAQTLTGSPYVDRSKGFLLLFVNGIEAPFIIQINQFGEKRPCKCKTLVM